jgi:DNA (cytosine-5)-methyltransferase 1
MMTIGSLFSGIGGLELGLERAGLGPVLWQCEIDPFCRAVLAKHWPDVERFEDVTQPRSYPHVDLICGGFPCQDVSSGGKRRGIGGSRSGLWWYFARVVAQVRPRYVVVENVSSGARRWLHHVREGLHVLGYRTSALGVAARDVGAPHRRARVFVVAYASGEQLRKQPGGGCRPDWTGAALAEDHGRARDMADADADGAGRDERAGGGASAEGKGGRASEGRGASVERPWAVEPGVGRVAHGVPDRVDRLTALGNAVVPQCAEIVGRVIQQMVRQTVGKEGI